MPNTAQVTFSVTNLTFSIAALAKGISFVQGITQRGPIADPSILITSWKQFETIYGGLLTSTDFPLLCKRALDRGAALRVSRVVNYSSLSVPTTTAVKGPAKNIQNATPTTLFQLRPKYHGADYNNLRATISAASNGNADYFNLAITHIADASINEVYQNLTIPATGGFGPTLANANFLQAIVNSSNFVDVTYVDLSAVSSGANLRPAVGTTSFTGGSDGSAVTATDYTGDSAGKTGFYAFDGYSDALQMATPEISTSSVLIAGAAYAAARKDIIYFAHLDNASTTVTALLADRTATNIDTPYCSFFAGGLKVINPSTGIVKNISEIGDILGAAAYNDNVAEPWFSFAGYNRGFIPNCLGVVNNFGSAGQLADLNQLANRQINMVVQSNGRIYLSGNFSAQLAYNSLSSRSIIRMLIWMQKTMGPTLQGFLEEPCDLYLCRLIHQVVKPFLDDLVKGRALFSYVWQGDQDVSKIEDMVVNNPNDFQNGIYKVRLWIKPINSLQQLGVEIVVTNTATQFNLLSA